MKLSEWKYDTAWNRIITKNKNGLQVVVMDQVAYRPGYVLVEKANKFIERKCKNE